MVDIDSSSALRGSFSGKAIFSYFIVFAVMANAVLVYTQSTNSTAQSNIVQNCTLTIFTESGLPMDTMWSITYANSVSSSASNSVIFSPMQSGIYIFNTSNIIVNGIKYTPNPSNGSLQCGSSFNIDFTTPVNQAQTTNHSTVQASQSAQSNPNTQTIALSYSRGRNFGNNIVATSNSLSFMLQKSLISNILVNLNTNSLKFNISITNQSTPIPQASNSYLVNPRSYQFISIDSSVNGGGNIDNYVTNVTYDFSVPSTWESGTNPYSMTLMKQENGGWQPMPTTYIGSSGGYYEYSAISNSFSYYTVGLTSSNAIATNQIILTLPTGFSTYFWSAAMQISFGSVNWTTDADASITFSPNNPPGSDVGHNAIYSTGDLIGAAGSSGTSAADNGLVLSGMGANVLIGNGNMFTNESNQLASGAHDEFFNVLTANSFVILLLASGSGDASKISSIAWPTGCNVQQNTTDATYFDIAAIATCADYQTTGQTLFTYTESSSKAGVSYAAYVFPPYGVTLDDSPSTGQITTNGGTWASGTVVNVIGEGTITAVPPSGYALNYWSVDNPNNAIITSNTATTTTIIVMGNVVLTANYIQANIPTNFIETGLPSGTTWSVTYKGSPESASTSNILFMTDSGNFAYSIPSVQVGSNTYVANTPSGYWVSGNTFDVEFGIEPRMNVQFNPVFLGVSDNITANAVPSSDGIEILANGVVKQTGSGGNVLFNANSLSTAADYLITAKDTTTGAANSIVLHVEPDPTSIDNVIAITFSMPNVTVSSSETLSSDLIGYDITINSGVTLTANGYSIIAAGNFINDGNIITGNVPNGGLGGVGTAAGANGASFLSSYAGSGGGGGGNDGGKGLSGGSGGNTIASAGSGGAFDAAGGAGATPPSPPLSDSTIANWYSSGIQNHLESASGGGGAGYGTGNNGGNGGGSALGMFIEAGNITVGNVYAAGVPGNAAVGTKSAGGGGSGGGSILLVYGTNCNGCSGTGLVVTAGAGGAGGTSTNGGGNGGAGRIITYQYTNIPVPVIPSPFQVLVPTNSAKYSGIEASNLDNIEFFLANTIMLSSWLETNNINTAANSLYWVKLPDGFNNNQSMTIYMGFANPSTNLMNQYTGESPYLSTNYGQYDSGTNTFVAYANGTMNTIFTLDSNMLSINTISGVTLPTGATGNVLEPVTDSTNSIAWAGIDIGLSRYIINGYIMQNAANYQEAGLGGEMGSTPRGYIFGAGESAGPTPYIVSLAEESSTASTVLAGVGTGGVINSWMYLQGIYDDGTMTAIEGRNVLQAGNTVTATDTTFTGNYAGIAAANTLSSSTPEVVGYMYVHTYPLIGAQPLPVFNGNIMNIPVSATCGISLSPGSFTFGTMGPGATISTSNVVTDTNYGGGVPATVYLSGSNWISSGTSNFYVTNTEWNGAKLGTYNGNALQLFPSGATSTTISIGGGLSANVYFGLAIPTAQPPATYTQNIVFENQC